VIVAGTLALASRGRLSILIFHRVLPERDALFPGEPTAAEFDVLLAHLRTRFTMLPLHDAVDRLYRGTLPRAALAVTFDDGYADNLAVAAPLLRKHGVPATLFIATGYLDGGIMWNDRVIAALRSTARDQLDMQAHGLGVYPARTLPDRRTSIDRLLRELKHRLAPERERLARLVLEAAAVEPPANLMLTSDGVRSLAEYGIDVGAHTIMHPILARLSQKEAWREICEGKRALETIVGHPVPFFAYPNGRPGDDYAAEHVCMVHEAGYTAAVNTAWGAADNGSDRLQLPRFTPWTRKPLRFDLLMLRNITRSSPGALQAVAQMRRYS
jgi:peptidoglycan/xylan/chitin deacetylase (PgdA/CDA1 family)